MGAGRAQEKGTPSYTEQVGALEVPGTAERPEPGARACFRAGGGGPDAPGSSAHTRGCPSAPWCPLSGCFHVSEQAVPCSRAAPALTPWCPPGSTPSTRTRGSRCTGSVASSAWSQTPTRWPSSARRTQVPSAAAQGPLRSVMLVPARGPFVGDSRDADAILGSVLGPVCRLWGSPGGGATGTTLENWLVSFPP